jgi:cytochrome c
MTYDGVPDVRDRTDLIAYLKHVNDTPECAPPTPASASQR